MALMSPVVAAMMPTSAIVKPSASSVPVTNPIAFPAYRMAFVGSTAMK